ncbi:hypothetical protein N7509_002888 [Penicillium cosmopolitanum]|uniref:Uncharacterized protein n=1 Tax=Penicillium cosmopolitanum TaxID=1131564 RepID=A0A9X0BDW0_9EURO|nr:uncharacterized protein N7509_002888 [Penicillium cosmopolitanum]KAJ5409005.1 hypothetical protein N7509_002888 [Penicillium cosmopolitanum]
MTQTTVNLASEDLKDRKDVLVMTSRDLMTLNSHKLGYRQNSRQCLGTLVRHLRVCPRYLLAKGDMRTEVALGLPVLRCQIDEDLKSQYQGRTGVKRTEISFIISPGDVGDVDSLASVVEQ